MEKEIYSNCYGCGKDLVKGGHILAVHQYYYCDDYCLNRDIKQIVLGKEVKE